MAIIIKAFCKLHNDNNKKKQKNGAFYMYPQPTRLGLCVHIE